MGQRDTDDTLTGVANRPLLVDHLRHGIAYGERYVRMVATFVINIDHFKYVNQSLGHDAGDELLKGVRSLLYKEGYTIRGVQNILKEEGVAYVAGVGRGEIVPRKRDGALEGAPPPGRAKPAPRVGKSLPAPEPARPANRLSDNHAESLRAALRELGEARKLLDPALSR